WRVAVEPGTHQLAKEWPTVLGGGRRMDAHEATATANIAFKCPALRVVEHIAGCAEEHHGGVPVEVVRRECGRVLRGFDGQAEVGADRAQGGHTRGNRIVPVARRLRSEEHT